MKKEDFDKMDEMYLKNSQKKVQSFTNNFFNNEPNSHQDFNLADISKQNAIPSGSNAFKALKDQKNKKYKNQTKTKWDTFQPYAFSKLSQTQKSEHFLQLFDDYLAVKIKLNQEAERYKKLMGKNTFLESEVSRLKTKSPDNKNKHKKISQEAHQNVQLKQEVRRLHQKIVALTGNKHKITPANTRPQSAAKTQKAIFPSTQNIKAQLQLERKQVRELLLIIDELKSQKFSLQTQLKEKQFKQGGPSKVYNPVPNNKVNNQSQFQTYAYDLQRWKQKYNDLQLCFNKMSEEKDRRIKQLQIENINFKENQRLRSKTVDFSKLNQMNSSHLKDKITDLEREKESLERQLRRLVSLPFNQNNNNAKNQLETQEKCSRLELALQKMKDQLTKTKEQSSKYFADLEYRTREVALLKSENEKYKKQLKQLIQKQTSSKTSTTEIDYDDYYRKLLGIVKLEGDDPIWRKFSNISAPSFNTMTENMIKKFAQETWVSKLQLLAHLEKAQIELRTMRESTQSRIGLYLKDKEHLEEELRIVRARLDQWTSMQKVGARRDVELHQSLGIQYDDSISVFQSQEQELKELQAQQNYFDLFLGQLILDQNNLMRNPQNKLKQITQMISFLTVDFYNHDTQHSNFVEGNSKKLANNYSFKVDMSQAFVKYLTKQSVMLELWSPQGSSTILLGKGQIWLRDLVANAVKDVSAVIRGKCPFYNQIDKSLVATLQYRLRMRLPIGSYCQWNVQDNKPGKAINAFRLGQRKRLELKILYASDLPSSSNHFVYFSLQGDDYYTEPVRGSSPDWNYRKEIELMMNEQLQEQLKQKYLQLTVFDDEKPVNQDVVGIAKADLTKLIDSVQQLKLDLQIKDTSFRTVGKLKIELKWL